MLDSLINYCYSGLCKATDKTTKMLTTIADLDNLVGHDRCHAISETTDLNVLLGILTEKKWVAHTDIHWAVTNILKVATESDFQNVETVLISVLQAENHNPYYLWFLCHSILQVNPNNKVVFPDLEKIAFGDDFKLSVYAKRDLGIDTRTKEAREFQEYQTELVNEILSKEIKTVDDVLFLFNLSGLSNEYRGGLYRKFMEEWGEKVHENPGYYIDKYGKNSKFFDVFTAELNQGLVELPKC